MKKILLAIILGGVLVGGMSAGTYSLNTTNAEPVTEQGFDKQGGETNPTRDYFDAEGNKYDYQGNLIQPVAPVIEAPQEQSSCR
jgi:hypothetical protein